MVDWLESFILTFIPLFIVIDAIGSLPFFITVSEGSSLVERRRIIHISTLTALIVGLAFLFFGRFILNVLGISVGAFTIAGGNAEMGNNDCGGRTRSGYPASSSTSLPALNRASVLRPDELPRLSSK